MRFEGPYAKCVGRAVAVAILALAAVLPAACSASEYVILVDCTGTMRYQGRADAAMQALRDFVSATSPGDFVTIYGYGEEPFAALPEYPWRIEPGDSWGAMSGSMTLPFTADRTDITRGLELVWSERELVVPSVVDRTAAGSPGTSCVVLLTDGKLIPCYDDYSEYDGIYARSRSRLLELASLFGDAGVPIYSVGLGSDEKVDGKLLAEVSRRSGGSYLHSATSGDLAGVFGTLVAAIMAAPSAGELEVAAAPRASVEEQVRPEDSKPAAHVSREPAVVEETPRPSPVHAEDPRTTATLGAHAAHAAFKDIASTVHQTILGILGVVVGFVAIGVQRKQSWTHAFTKPLLKREIRVKGYFRPTYPEGIVGARCCIPIENPGLPAVEVGEGAELGADLGGILVEMVGTADGSPPTLRVIKGQVKVNGAAVENETKLEDGDTVEFKGLQYSYLRGCRR